MTNAIDEQVEVRHGYFNPWGTQVESREEAFTSPEAVTTTVRMTLHNGGVTFEIEAQISPSSYPFRLTGGQIKSGICGAPWNITGGYLGDDMRLDATRAGDGNCANTISIVGEFVHPAAYRGTYGFDGTSSSFPHATLYHG